MRWPSPGIRLPSVRLAGPLSRAQCPNVSASRAPVSPESPGRPSAGASYRDRLQDKELMRDTRYLGRAKHPFSGKIAAAFRAETAIDRRDFGVTWNAAMDTRAAYLGERVQISLAILAVRQD